MPSIPSPSSADQPVQDSYMLNLFFTEVREFLLNLERDLLQLDQVSEGQEAKLFRQLLRSAHSIKGSASMFELELLAKGSHYLEDSLKAVQPLWPQLSGQERNQVLSVLLQSIDRLGHLAIAAEKGGDGAVELEQMVVLLQDLQPSPPTEGSGSLSSSAGAMPSLLETILTGELPPLIEQMILLCDHPTPREVAPQLLDCLQQLNGIAQMLQLPDLQAAVESLETVTGQALLSNEEELLEQLSPVWIEGLIAIEQTRIQALQTQLPDPRSRPGQDLPGIEPVFPESAVVEDSNRSQALKDPAWSASTLYPLDSNPSFSKIDARRVDTLMNLVGELIIHRTVLDRQRQDFGRITRQIKLILRQIHQAGQTLREAYDQVSTQTENQPGSRLGEQFDSLEWDRYSHVQESAHELLERVALLEAKGEGLVDLDRSLDQVGERLNKVSGHLRDEVLRLRVAPFSQMVDHLPRAVRELSQSYSKTVDLVLYGRNIEIDEQVLAQLRDPITHLVRNAFDHGIEPPSERASLGKPPGGRIEIEAQNQGGYTLITVKDDGRGIDLAKVRRKAELLGYFSAEQAAQLTETELWSLLFLPEFSTTDQVSDLSGRGVGLDIVKTAVEQLRGQVQIQSQKGQGTTFTLRLPLVLSIIQALLVRVDRDVLAIPLERIAQMLRLVPQDWFDLGDRPLILWQGLYLPLLKLPDILHYQGPHPDLPQINPLSVEKHRLPVLILKRSDERSSLQPLAPGSQSPSGYVALAVDQLLGQQEIVLKGLPPLLPKPTAISGTTILGTGQVVLVLDTEELIRLGYQPMPEESSGSSPMPLDPIDPSVPRVLVVDDSYSVREMVGDTLRRAGYRVDQAQDGRAAVHRLSLDPNYQMIVTDLEMPHLDGLELLKLLQSQPHLSRIPVVVLTSRSGEKHRSIALSLGAKAYLTKPFQKGELLTWVKDLTSSSGN